MAHNSDYSHIWAETGSGLTVSEIRSALGVASRDVGALCTSPAINKWAKYKPIRVNKTSRVTENERNLHRYGISLNPTTGYWEYIVPGGMSAGEPFRMLDFDGYNNKAIPPMYELNSVPNPIAIDTDTLTISPEAFFPRNVANVELPLNLFPTMYSQDFYIGFLVRNNEDGNMRYYTGGTTIKNYFDGATAQPVNISLSGLGANAGDEIEVWVCCARNGNVTQGAMCTPAMLGVDVVKIALSETLGHALTIATVFSASNLYYIGDMRNELFSPNVSSPVNYVSHITGAYVDLFVDYLFASRESSRIVAELLINGTLVDTQYLSVGNANIDANGMLSIGFSGFDHTVQFAQGDEDFPIGFSVVIYKADGSWSPVGNRVAMWLSYTYDAALHKCTNLSILQGRNANVMDELYFVETKEKIQAQTLLSQGDVIHIEDRSLGNTRRTYILTPPSGYGITYSVNKNIITISGLSNLPVGDEFEFTLRGHIGPSSVPQIVRTFNITYWP